jgi:hypothetical protein
MLQPELKSALGHYLSLPEAFSPIEEAQLKGQLAHELRRPVDDGEFSAALQHFKARGELNIAGKTLKRAEPDRKEQELERPVRDHFETPEGLRSLKVDTSHPHRFVNIARGGKRSGQNSIPDFALVQLRKPKFSESGQHIYVTAFELKNRKGTGNSAVIETANYKRFARQSFLIVPFSEGNPKLMEEMREDARLHQIGLFFFDLKFDGRTKAAVPTNFRKEVEAPLNNAPLEAIEKFIVDRNLDQVMRELQDSPS